MGFASNNPSRVHLYCCTCIQKLLDSRTTCVWFWPLISGIKPHSKTVQTQEVSGLWCQGQQVGSSLNTKTLSNVLQQSLHHLPHRHHHLNNKTPNQSFPPDQRPWFTAWDTALEGAGLMTNDNSPLHAALLEVALFRIVVPIFCLQRS